jgi:PAS domain S-box-containing protein
MPAAVVIVEAPSGRILFANARAHDMTEQQLGRPIPPELQGDFEIFHPDGRPYAMEEWPLVRSMTSGENVVEEEYFNVLADGSRLTVSCSSSPIFDASEHIVAGLLVMNDVTEQRGDEERLGYHSRLLEAVEDAVIAMDEQFILNMWNRGAERIYGWTAEEVLGREASDVVRLAMSGAERAAMRRRTADVGRLRMDAVAYRKDGTPVDVELITVAVRDDQGEISGYLGIHRDTSERKRAEARLTYQARLLESLNDAVMATDEQFVLTAWNRAAEEMFGWTSEEAVGRTVHELIPTNYSEKELAAGLRKLTEEGLWFISGELWYGKDGRLVSAEARAVALRDEDGQISGFLCVMRDSGEHDRAQREIERRARQQAVVARLGLRALTTDHLQSLMDDAVALAARTLDVEYAKLAELLPGEDELLIRAAFGWRRGVVGSETEPAGRGSLAGYTVLSRQPVVIEDLAAETRFSPSAVVLEHRAASGAAVLVSTPQVPWGVLEALATHRRAFSDDDVNFLQAIANVLATAVERAQAETNLREVREGERRRIARDLHDEALRDLAYALVESHRIEAASAQDEAASHLRQLVPALQRVGQQVRSAIYDLRLEGEADRWFPELLDSLVGLHRAMAQDCDIELDVREGVPTAPLGRRGTEALRILGEALTNARRHSGARRIRVGVWGSEDKLWMEVSDDGRGFDPAREPAGGDGTGIKSMRERTALLGGDLQIRSEPGAGTKVRLELPRRERGPDPGEEVRILLVEDHVAVREAVASAFVREEDFTVVGQAASLAEARGMLDEVDVAVVDLALPDGYGGDLITELRDANPGAQALVLSASIDRADIARAVESGAAGVLAKTAHLDEVVESVRRLRAGEALMPLAEVVDLLRFASRRRQREHDDRLAISRLTPREREVLQGLAEGLDSQGIAERLHITGRTERNHVASILTKLGVHSRLQALVFGLRYGVVRVP